MKCKYEGSGVWKDRCVGTKEVDPCVGYDQCDCFRPNYKTNADRIRSMTDEELAEFLDQHGADTICDLLCGGGCNAIPTLTETEEQRCRKIILEVLKRPYKEDA